MHVKSWTRFSEDPKSRTCTELSRSVPNRKWLGRSVIAFALVVVGPVAHAQQPGKIFRIGYLDNSTASGSAVLLEAFRQELSKLGWIDGKNITIEYRFAEQKPEYLLVRLKVDLIVTSGGPTALVAKKATSTIPIVMTSLRIPSVQVWLPIWPGREAMSPDFRV